MAADETLGKTELNNGLSTASATTPLAPHCSSAGTESSSSVAKRERTIVSTSTSFLLRPSSWIKLAIALLLVFRFHLWHLPTSFPHVQPIVYPAQPGQDIVYGLRVIIPITSKGKPDQLLLEIGKIPDDALKGRVLDSFVGLSDSWFFFKIQTNEDAHYLLATLFMANLVTRQEANQILRKGPTSSPSDSNSTSLFPAIHRIPSLMTLSAAYYAGAEIGTRVIFRQIRLDSSTAPVIVGVATVTGTMVLFSKSSTAENEIVSSKSVGEEVRMVGLGSVGMQSVWTGASGGKGRVEVGMIKVLEEEEWTRNPLFVGSPSFGAQSFGVTDAFGEDWLDVAMAGLRNQP